MKTYEVRFNIDGKPAGSIMVTAKDSIQARRMAEGEIGGMPGYAGRKIRITSTNEIR